MSSRQGRPQRTRASPQVSYSRLNTQGTTDTTKKKAPAARPAASKGSRKSNKKGKAPAKRTSKRKGGGRATTTTEPSPKRSKTNAGAPAGRPVIVVDDEQGGEGVEAAGASGSGIRSEASLLAELEVAEAAFADAGQRLDDLQASVGEGDNLNSVLTEGHFESFVEDVSEKYFEVLERLREIQLVRDLTSEEKAEKEMIEREAFLEAPPGWHSDQDDDDDEDEDDDGDGDGGGDGGGASSGGAGPTRPVAAAGNKGKGKGKAVQSDVPAFTVMLHNKKFRRGDNEGLNYEPWIEEEGVTERIKLTPVTTVADAQERLSVEYLAELVVVPFVTYMWERVKAMDKIQDDITETHFIRFFGILTIMSTVTGRYEDLYKYCQSDEEYEWGDDYARLLSLRHFRECKGRLRRYCMGVGVSKPGGGTYTYEEVRRLSDPRNGKADDRRAYKIATFKAVVLPAYDKWNAMMAAVIVSVGNVVCVDESMAAYNGMLRGLFHVKLPRKPDRSSNGREAPMVNCPVSKLALAVVPLYRRDAVDVVQPFDEKVELDPEFLKTVTGQEKMHASSRAALNKRLRYSVRAATVLRLVAHLPRGDSLVVVGDKGFSNFDVISALKLYGIDYVGTAREATKFRHRNLSEQVKNAGDLVAVRATVTNVYAGRRYCKPVGGVKSDAGTNLDVADFKVVATQQNVGRHMASYFHTTMNNKRVPEVFEFFRDNAIHEVYRTFDADLFARARSATDNFNRMLYGGTCVALRVGAGGGPNLRELAFLFGCSLVNAYCINNQWYKNHGKGAEAEAAVAPGVGRIDVFRRAVGFYLAKWGEEAAEGAAGAGGAAGDESSNDAVVRELKRIDTGFFSGLVPEAKQMVGDDNKLLRRKCKGKVQEVVRDKVVGEKGCPTAASKMCDACEQPYCKVHMPSHLMSEGAASLKIALPDVYDYIRRAK